VNIFHGKDSQLNVNKFTNLVNKLIINHGEVEAIKRLKHLRLNLQQFVLGQSLTLRPLTKIDKDSFPKSIKFMKPNRNDLNECRYSISIMRIIELFKDKTSSDTSTITDKSTADPILIQDIKEFISKCHWLKSIEPINVGYLPMSNRAGPNGPASISSIADLTALRQKENAELYDAIKQQLRVTIS